MSSRKTSFGRMEVLSEDPLVERMTFESKGSSHTHDTNEYCYVLSGSGRVVGAVGDESVSEGDLCVVPPDTDHWMIPEEKPFKLLIFYGSAT